MALLDQLLAQSTPQVSNPDPSLAPTAPPPVSLTDIINQHFQTQAQQSPQNDIVQKILGTRFQPTPEDRFGSLTQNMISAGLPDQYKPQSPQDVATQRVAGELAPFSTMLDYGIKEKQGTPDFTKMAQQAFLKQASGQPMTLQDQAAVNAWRNMGQNGIMFDPNTGSMIQTNTRMPGGMAIPGGTPQAQPGNPSVNPGTPIPSFGGNASVGSGGQFPTPKSQAEFLKNLADKQGGDLGEASKMYNVMQSNLPQALSRFSDMRKAAVDSNFGFGTNDEGTGFKQQLSDQLQNNTSKSNNILLQKSAQSLLPEIGPVIAQTGGKGNMFMERMAAQASGLRFSAPPSSKQDIINGLENTYISNLKATAAQLRANGMQAPSDADIDAQVMQLKQNNPVTNSNAANTGQSVTPSSNVQTAINPSTGQRIYLRNGQWQTQ